MKVGRHHADDGVGAPVESQRPAERRGIPSQLAPPEPVGEHRDARSSSDVLVCEWRPPDDRPRAKSGVEAGAHARDANLRRRPASGERLLLGPDPCSRFEGAVLRRDIEKVGSGERPARIDAGRPFVDADELLR